MIQLLVMTTMPMRMMMGMMMDLTEFECPLCNNLKIQRKEKKNEYYVNVRGRP